MPFQKGHKLSVGNKGGRKGYGIELQKKRLLDLAFHTTKKALLKEEETLVEKEKVDLAKQIVLKELGKNIDITSKGEKIIPIYGGQSNIQGHTGDEEDISTEEKD